LTAAISCTTALAANASTTAGISFTATTAGLTLVRPEQVLLRELFDGEFLLPFQRLTLDEFFLTEGKQQLPK